MSATLKQIGELNRQPTAGRLGDLVRPGRLTEISGTTASAQLTTAVAVVRVAQQDGETTAWIQAVGGPLFPPDLADSGLDLDALVVVQIPAERGRAGIARAAELLLSSGAFGLCVLDIGALGVDPDGAALVGTAWQARLAALARTHESRVVVLTRGLADRDSLGPMVGTRLQPRRERHQAGVFEVHMDVLKNKGGAPTELPVELRRGPWGVC